MITDLFTSALFDDVEDKVSQPIFDPTLDTQNKSFIQNSGVDDFKSLRAGIKIR